MNIKDISDDELIRELCKRFKGEDNKSINIYNINQSPDVRLLTIKEVSEKLKINVSDTYKLIKSGSLNALKLGSLKVTSCELERFIKEATNKEFYI